MKKTVLVLGNPVIDIDKLPIKLVPKLKKKFPHVNFIHFDPTEELPNRHNKNLIIIDTVIGIGKITKFNGLNQWILSPRTTVHDYDLPLSLGILKKLGKIKDITVIGIPPTGRINKIFRELTLILTTSGI